METIKRVREVDQSSKIVISTTVVTPEMLRMKEAGEIDMILTVPFQSLPMWQKLDELLNK